MKIKVIDYNEVQRKVSYETSLDTIAGNISFENEAYFMKGKNGYELIWKDSLIFPELNSTDKVKVVLENAKRGNILDRNGDFLAGESTVYSVGVVPYEMQNKNKDIDKIAELLNIDRESIESKLSAKWVKKEDNVPIKLIPKVEDFEALGPNVNVDEETIAKKELYNKLLVFLVLLLVKLKQDNILLAGQRLILYGM